LLRNFLFGNHVVKHFDKVYAKLKYLILLFLLIGIGFTIFNYIRILEYEPYPKFRLPELLFSILIIFFFLPRKLKIRRKYLTFFALATSFIFMLISINIISPFSLSLNFFKDYSIENYPKSASKTGTYEHIESCYFMQSGDINFFPKNIKDSIDIYYQKRIGKEYFKRLKFDFGYIYSDKPIQDLRNKTLIDSIFDYEERLKNCDTTNSYPVYTSAYSLIMEEVGIEKLGLNLVIDSKGRIIKDFQFPHFKESSNERKIIPIDSVNLILKERKISTEKLHMSIDYDDEKQSLYWFPKTIIRPGSITGPSCFPEIEYHFFMNMFTGEIIEVNEN